MSKLSYNELIQKKQGLLQVLENDKEYNFDLVYAFKKNVNKINKEIEEIDEILPDNDEEFVEFQQKNVELLREAGAEFNQTQQGSVQITNPDEVDMESYQEKFKDLKEEYNDAIDRQDKIDEKRADKLNNKVVEIEWFPIEKEFFPETITPKELPSVIIDLIKEE